MVQPPFVRARVFFLSNKQQNKFIDFKCFLGFVDATINSESPVKSQIPDKPVEITLDAPDIMKKKR